MQDFTRFRTEYEATIMSLQGVAGMGEGADEAGNPCLMIYTTIATDLVRPNLPQAIGNIAHQLVFTGDINAL